MQTPDESFESYYKSLGKMDKIKIGNFYNLLRFYAIWCYLLLFSLPFGISSSERISHNITIFFKTLNYDLEVRIVIFDAMKRIKSEYYYPVIIYTIITQILALISRILTSPKLINY